MATDNYIFGKNAVLEALRAGRQIQKLYVLKDGGSYGEVTALARSAGTPVSAVPKAKLDELAAGGRHQGVIASAPPFEYSEADDILRRAARMGEVPFIVVLDHIEDPHNLGAIIRTAECVGAHGVIIPKNRAAAVTPTAERAAAGAASYIPIARVANICTCLDTLKKDANIWVYCAVADGKPLYEADMSGPIALVIGAEGNGVSPIVKRKCDFEISIPMYGQITSLNASVAAGVVLYEAVRRRNFHNG